MRATACQFWRAVHSAPFELRKGCLYGRDCCLHESRANKGRRAPGGRAIRHHGQTKEDGIPESQWSYEIVGDEIKLKPNYMSLTGYRLPTESEMEYATRTILLPRLYGEGNVGTGCSPLAVIKVGENPVGPPLRWRPEGGVQTLRLNKAFRVRRGHGLAVASLPSVGAL
jgi:hypothetical protein